MVFQCLVERLQPPGDSSAQQQVALRNSAVRNGFHIPSLMLALVIFLQLTHVTKTALVLQTLPDAEESQLCKRLFGTAFDPYVVNAFPGLLGTDEILACMQSQLPQIPCARGLEVHGLMG